MFPDKSVARAATVNEGASDGVTGTENLNGRVRTVWVTAPLINKSTNAASAAETVAVKLAVRPTLTLAPPSAVNASTAGAMVSIVANENVDAAACAFPKTSYAG